MNNKTVFTAVSNSTVPASVLLGSKNKAAKNGLSFESLLSEGLNSTAKKTRGSEAQAYNSAFSNHLEANTSESAFSPVFSKETGLKGGFEHNTTEWPQNELENEQSIAAKKVDKPDGSDKLNRLDKKQEIEKSRKAEEALKRERLEERERLKESKALEGREEQERLEESKALERREEQERLEEREEQDRLEESEEQERLEESEEQDRLEESKALERREEQEKLEESEEQERLEERERLKESKALDKHEALEKLEALAKAEAAKEAENAEAAKTTENLADELESQKLSESEQKSKSGSDGEKIAAEALCKLLANANLQAAAKEPGAENVEAELPQALNELVKELSHDELQEMADNPEKFVEALKADIEEMPDSPEKNEILLAIQTQEFSEMLQNTAETALESTHRVAEERGKKAELGGLSPSSALKKAIQNEEQETKAESQKDKGAIEQAKAKTADKKALTEGKQGQAEQGGSVLPKESLRDEFSRVHEPTKAASEAKAAEAAEAVKQTAQNDNGLEQASEASQGLAQQLNEGTKGNIRSETAAQRFVNLLKSRLNASTGHNAAAAQGTRASKRHGTAGKNSGGFGFNYGAKEMPNRYAKSGESVRQTSSVFAEMLEKARLFKTKSGERVLNLELKQSGLGKLSMKLASKHGSVVARVLVEDSMAKTKLEELAPQLKRQLFEQGVNLAEVTVDISSGETGENSSARWFEGKKSTARINELKAENAEEIIEKNFLPNLRRCALNIQAIDMTV